MSARAEDWIEKAEGDFSLAKLALRPDLSPNHDGVCFHAQQCIKKLMKGFLIQNQIKPPLTHNLFQLGGLIKGMGKQVSWSDTDVRYLTRVGAGFRYPGESADLEDATKPMEVCGRLRDELLVLLGQRLL